MRQRRRLLTAVSLVAALGLVAAACGDDEPHDLRERGCVASMLDSVGGEYPTDLDSGCIVRTSRA